MKTTLIIWSLAIIALAGFAVVLLTLALTPFSK
jgi:hypothetical protein